MCQIATYILTSLAESTKERRRLKITFGINALPTTVDKLITCAFRLLENMCLAERSSRGSQVTLYGPPVASRNMVATALNEMLGLAEKETRTLTTALSERDESPVWDVGASTSTVAMVGDTLKKP